MRGFSGHLPPEQLLYLWDLILGYDSLEIIPLLAVTILSFRKENLMQVSNLHNVEAVLSDLSSLKVMPLLQLVLLKE
ncbi:TBC1 domain family member 19-like [Belonocnema kinseyi]|uniref:TBC1 domain family member 19-like n=1 Tax=Belonocnema kinseyi TaxID=2817044 RepID=UPI00143DBD3B|nr:TBC1 domain family member 19-like [Belonocnema kinseyi]